MKIHYRCTGPGKEEKQYERNKIPCLRNQGISSVMIGFILERSG